MQTERINTKIMQRQVQQNLKKNLPPNSAEAFPTVFQKESALKFCGGSSHRISKRIRPKILWRQLLPNLKKNPPQSSEKESTPKFCRGSTRQISKRIQMENSVEAVPAESQKEFTPKFCGVSSRRISKRIRIKILWRQFPPNLKKNPPPNYVESIPAESQKEWCKKNRRSDKCFVWSDDRYILESLMEIDCVHRINLMGVKIVVVLDW